MSKNNDVVVVVQPDRAAAQDTKPKVDIGAQAREIADASVEEGEPLTSTPQFNAMMALLEQDGHNVDGVIDEINRMKDSLNAHLAVHRSLARNVASIDSMHAARLAKRK